MKRIDSHIHLNANHPEITAVLRDVDVKIHNICVDGNRTIGWRKYHRDPYATLAESDSATFAWCTTFDIPDDKTYAEPAAYARRVIEQLEADFEAGALACKVWKNIGMEAKDAAGRHIMVDDPIFQPIFTWLTEHKHPLLAHIAEPYACWQPLAPDSPHFGYYSKNPQWHMHGRTDVPSHAALMVARDHVIERNPRMKFIGAHFGSQEYSLPEIARRLDRFPNYAVDTSARLGDIASHEREEARAFIIKYQDRILWGTDMVFADDHAAMPPEKRAKVVDYMRQTYPREFDFYASDKMVQIGKRQVRGLNLPADVQQKLFITNAQQWYPGM